MLKSPMNYIGNKYRLLSQLFELFPNPETIRCSFLDLFAGGLDVSINYHAKHIIANDINYHLIEIYKEFQKNTYEYVIKYLDSMIEKYGLSKTNKEAYLKFRNYYNSQDIVNRNPLDLYLLINYSFNYQVRFNSSHEYNNPFGANRSSFNNSLRARLQPFMSSLASIDFISKDFREVNLDTVDFIYADPAYTLSIGSYNDGKRGFKGWSLQDDIDLMTYLDEADKRGIRFALSNVLVHKGKEHKEMIVWSNKYHVHDMVCSYDNCNYQTENKNYTTREVLITNY